jgi:hypothetical protein
MSGCGKSLFDCHPYPVLKLLLLLLLLLLYIYVGMGEVLNPTLWDLGLA